VVNSLLTPAVTHFEVTRWTGDVADDTGSVRTWRGLKDTQG